ncbi:MAG: endonuclease III [Nanoarchaeota archaeon]
MNKKEYFLDIFHKAEKKYGKSEKRLAGEGWEYDWQLIVTTIMSAQSRDETTIPIAEGLFRKYASLDKLANANYEDVLQLLRSLNYNRTKSKNIIACAKMLVTDFNGKVPDNIDELVKLPGVGRKTANLVLGELHSKDAICVDVHVHRISNAIGLVKTKNPTETELALQKIAPKNLWSRINRIFVLWGKSVRGYDKKNILAMLKE